MEVWCPQEGPQKALIDCTLPEVFFGGARGGGKTDAVLGKYAIKGERYGNGFNAIFFRRELPMCDDAIERSHDIMGALGWSWNAAKYAWRSPLGARLRFRPLERVRDAEKYKGQNVSDVCVEEAGDYPDPRPIDRLHGILRSAQHVPTQLILTGNPGGPGQGWIRQRYIDPAPHGFKVLERDVEGAASHRFVFIPSKLHQNRFLNNDDYITRLHLVGSAELVRAWLRGDWDAVEGAFFDCWRADQHVLKPFALPQHLTRFRSFDWGSASPFSVGWWAVLDDDIRRPEGVLPRGALVRYREWYGASDANVGLKMIAEDVAQGILEREMTDEQIAYGVADTQIFEQDGGPSIAERMSALGLQWRPADKRRVPGWEQMRARMVGKGGRPMIYVFSTCVDFVRTVPVLQHDETKVEDLDTDSEDHVADEARYACMSRPFVTDAPDIDVPALRAQLPTFNDLRDLVGKRRQDL